MSGSLGSNMAVDTDVLAARLRGPMDRRSLLRYVAGVCSGGVRNARPVEGALQAGRSSAMVVVGADPLPEAAPRGVDVFDIPPRCAS